MEIQALWNIISKLEISGGAHEDALTLGEGEPREFTCETDFQPGSEPATYVLFVAFAGS